MSVLFESMCLYCLKASYLVTCFLSYFFNTSLGKQSLPPLLPSFDNLVAVKGDSKIKDQIACNIQAKPVFKKLDFLLCPCHQLHKGQCNRHA